MLRMMRGSSYPISLWSGNIRSIAGARMITDRGNRSGSLVRDGAHFVPASAAAQAVRSGWDSLLLMIAEDMQINGAQPVDSQGLHAVEARGRGRGRFFFWKQPEQQTDTQGRAKKSKSANTGAATPERDPQHRERGTQNQGGRE